MSTELPYAEIYTDGGCDPNPGPGGWAAILIDKKTGTERELSDGEHDTTNNRMELTAAIKALQFLDERHEVDLYTDSQYLRRGITEWIHNWIADNWRRGQSDVKNVDLWQELHHLTQQHEIHWHWVKGHAQNHYNERADQLASAAIPRTTQKIDTDAVQIYLRLSDEDVLRSCPRGWAACIVRDSNKEYLSGGHPADSPNHFALFAALEILNQLQNENRPVQFFVSGKFLYDGITGWVNGWRAKNWQVDKKFIPEWKALDRLSRSRKIEWVFMRHPMPAEYESLEDLTVKAKTKAPHLPMPPDMKETGENDTGTKPMF